MLNLEFQTQTHAVHCTFSWIIFYVRHQFCLFLFYHFQSVVYSRINFCLKFFCLAGDELVIFRDSHCVAIRGSSLLKIQSITSFFVITLEALFLLMSHAVLIERIFSERRKIPSFWMVWILIGKFSRRDLDLRLENSWHRLVSGKLIQI